MFLLRSRPARRVMQLAAVKSSAAIVFAAAVFALSSLAGLVDVARAQLSGDLFQGQQATFFCSVEASHVTPHELFVTPEAAFGSVIGDRAGSGALVSTASDAAFRAVAFRGVEFTAPDLSSSGLFAGRALVAAQVDLHRDLTWDLRGASQAVVLAEPLTSELARNNSADEILTMPNIGVDSPRASSFLPAVASPGAGLFSAPISAAPTAGVLPAK